MNLSTLLDGYRAKSSSTLLMLVFSGSLLTSQPLLADDDNKVLPQDTFWSWLISIDRHKGVNNVQNATHAEECGSCHFPYQPGLLPEKSWQQLLSAEALENHFGENAELDEDTLKEIQDFVFAYSAEKSTYKRSKQITHSIAENETPIRITDTRFFKRKHHEINEQSMVKDNKDVSSFSNCNACHTQAEHGVFDDDTVYIPNFGQDWEY